MHPHSHPVRALDRFAAALRGLLLCLLAGVVLPCAAQADPPAMTVEGELRIFNFGPGRGRRRQPLPRRPQGNRVRLPDDWWTSRPKEDGPVWYRAATSTRPALPNRLIRSTIERVCSNAEVYLNGQIVLQRRRMGEPITRNCYYPQLAAAAGGAAARRRATCSTSR